MRYIKLFENYKKENNSVGITWESDFSKEDKNIIEDMVHSRISEMVSEGFTSGELFGEEPDFEGWWNVSIEEDEHDEESRDKEVASKISQGYTSGYYPTFSWNANVW